MTIKYSYKNNIRIGNWDSVHSKMTGEGGGI